MPKKKLAGVPGKIDRESKQRYSVSGGPLKGYTVVRSDGPMPTLHFDRMWEAIDIRDLLNNGSITPDYFATANAA